MHLLVLFALLVNLQTSRADHYGIPHDLAYDEEEFAAQDGTSSNVTEQENLNDIYGQVLDQYASLPTQQQSDENDEEIFVGNPQEAYVQMIQDVNLFMAQMINKYNLTAAIGESKVIVSDKSWIQSLKNAENETQTRQEISEALTPITLQMMKIPAEDFVATMSDDIVNWLSDTSIAFAKIEGVDDEESNEINQNQNCDPIIEYVPIPIQIEKCSSAFECQCPDPLIIIDQSDLDDWKILENDEAFYNQNSEQDYDDAYYNYDYDANYGGYGFYDPYYGEDLEFLESSTDYDTDYDSYWYDSDNWSYTNDNGDVITETNLEYTDEDWSEEDWAEYDYSQLFYTDDHDIEDEWEKKSLFQRAVDWWTSV